jgi:hypothetical protein
MHYQASVEQYAKKFEGIPMRFLPVEYYKVFFSWFELHLKGIAPCVAIALASFYLD